MTTKTLSQLFKSIDKAVNGSTDKAAKKAAAKDERSAKKRLEVIASLTTPTKTFKKTNKETGLEEEVTRPISAGRQFRLVCTYLSAGGKAEDLAPIGMPARFPWKLAQADIMQAAKDAEVDVNAVAHVLGLVEADTKVVPSTSEGEKGTSATPPAAASQPRGKHQGHGQRKAS